MNITDKLNEAIKLCSIHRDRMEFAYGKIEGFFPLTVEKYNSLLPEQMSYMDQWIFRFSKLQDSMGSKLFPSILQILGEDVEGIPFIDKLNKLEKLNVLDYGKEWLLLREVRNVVIHEYPFLVEELINGLNLLYSKYKLILKILDKIDEYLNMRFGDTVKDV